jgi:hypothetical protein
MLAVATTFAQAPRSDLSRALTSGPMSLEAEIIMAMPRNLQRRPAKLALGNGRIQRAVGRAFYFGSEVTSSDVYVFLYKYLYIESRVQ